MLLLGHGYVVFDLSSANGTSVNDVPVHGAVQLHDGDRIGIARTKVSFVGPAGAVVPPLPSADARGTPGVVRTLDRR